MKRTTYWLIVSNIWAAAITVAYLPQWLAWYMAGFALIATIISPYKNLEDKS